MNAAQALAYKKAIADLYSGRSQTYDDSAWHEQIARQLVDYAHIRADARVLDIATGTGMVAFHAVSQLGPHGAVIGIDISPGMLATARSKLHNISQAQLRFELGDGESLAYPPDSFDFIFCGSAFIWMSDLHAALRHWRSRLKPQGRVGFHAFSASAFVTGIVAQAVLRKYGVRYAMNQPTGSVEKCRELLAQAGFKNTDIKVDQQGAYMSLEEAMNAWPSAAHPAPGQFPHPLASLTPEAQACARADYEQEIRKLNTQKGVWSDMTTFYVYGEK